MCGHDHHIPGQSCGCRGHGPRIERFIVPCLLLLLKEQPDHGYQLIERLGSLSCLEQVPDPAIVYRHLRQLEKEGMVVSDLQPGEAGPAKKVYSLTSEGEDYLKSWALALQNRVQTLRTFLEKYSRVAAAVEGEK